MVNEPGRSPAGATDRQAVRHRREREESLIRAFVDLADTMVDDYDVIDVLDRLACHSVDLLAADSAGILLLDGQGRLRVAASTDEHDDRMGPLQLETGQGPCVECVRTGAAVGVIDLAGSAPRWPAFAAALPGHDVHGSVHALPPSAAG